MDPYDPTAGYSASGARRQDVHDTIRDWRYLAAHKDTMVLGITDTECRIATFHYWELHAEAERQSLAAQAAPVTAGRARVMETMQRRIGAVMEQVSQLFQGVRTQEATDQAAAPRMVAVSK